MTRLVSWTLAALVATAPMTASAICRVVSPAPDSGTEAVAFDLRTAALMVLAPDQLVGYGCPETFSDFGIPVRPMLEQADYLAWMNDLGIGAPRPIDRASRPVDDGIARCWDGSAAAPIHGTLVSLVVQPAVVAAGGEGGLVMPVPARADVRITSPALMALAAAHVDPFVEETVTIVEDTGLGTQCSDPHYSSSGESGCGYSGGGGFGGSRDAGPYYRPGLDDVDTDEQTYDGGTVRFEELSTGTYDITVLSASSFAALLGWLDENGFAHSAIDDAVFQEYVGEGAWFVAVRVHPPEGHGLELEPIAVTWQGEALPLAHQLQYDPRGGLLVTDALVLAPERRDTADGTAFTEYAAPVVPTGALAGFGLPSGWLTRLSITRQVDEALPDTTLVRARSQVVRPTIERSTTVRIPGPCCGSARSFVHVRTYLESESPGIPMSFLTPPSACRSRGDGGCAVRSTGSGAFALAAIGLLALGLVWRGRRIARTGVSQQGPPIRRRPD